tara:strand:- start:939 stop:1307 length:369 start_codon:yes stop_codon:yes gene_type:complete
MNDLEVFLEENQEATEFIFNTDTLISQEIGTAFRIAMQLALTVNDVILLDEQAMGFTYEVEEDLPYDLQQEDMQYNFMLHFVIGVIAIEQMELLRQVLEMGLYEMSINYDFIDIKTIQKSRR